MAIAKPMATDVARLIAMVLRGAFRLVVGFVVAVMAAGSQRSLWITSIAKRYMTELTAGSAASGDQLGERR